MPRQQKFKERQNSSPTIFHSVILFPLLPNAAATSFMPYKLFPPCLILCRQVPL